jgi:pyruvate,orthophosphate dikinase
MSKKEISAEEDLFVIGPGSQKVLSAELAGSKAANLSQMARLGLQVPPAFILSTRLCSPINDRNSKVENALENMLSEGIAYLESVTNKRFGDRRRPLFVSVRSARRDPCPE